MTALVIGAMIVGWLAFGFLVYAADCRWDLGKGMEKSGVCGGAFVLLGPLFGAVGIVVGVVYLIGRAANWMVPPGMKR